MAEPLLLASGRAENLIRAAAQHVDLPPRRFLLPGRFLVVVATLVTLPVLPSSHAAATGQLVAIIRIGGSSSRR